MKIYNSSTANKATKKRRRSKAVVFTPSDRECMYYLLRGMSAGQIAITIKRSRRTVEDRIVNLKAKFNCRTRYELISNIWDTIFSFDESMFVVD